LLAQVGADTVGELLLEAAVQEADYSNGRRFDGGVSVPYDEKFERALVCRSISLPVDPVRYSSVESEKQIPRGLKSLRNDNLQSVVVGTTEVAPGHKIAGSLRLKADG
jgi:hypothetical protein